MDTSGNSKTASPCRISTYLGHAYHVANVVLYPVFAWVSGLVSSVAREYGAPVPARSSLGMPPAGLKTPRMGEHGRDDPALRATVVRSKYSVSALQKHPDLTNP